jgi:RHS repeat-associated protein
LRRVAKLTTTKTASGRALGLYGEALGRIGSTDTPFRFNGLYGVQTDSNGLYYHRARYYSPTLRRFINQDVTLGRIGSAASLNRFAYCNGEPINLIDPMGLMAGDRAPNDGTGFGSLLGGTLGEMGSQLWQGTKQDLNMANDMFFEPLNRVFDGVTELVGMAGNQIAPGFGDFIKPGVLPASFLIGVGEERVAAGAAESVTVAAGDGLAPSIRASFTGGQYTPWVADVDTVVYRAGNFGQGSGRFFGLANPVDSLDAEIMYNINKWGNNATQLSEHLIPAGTRGFIGGVEGGTGIQIFLPNTMGVQLIDSSTLFTSELKFITH